MHSHILSEVEKKTIKKGMYNVADKIATVATNFK